ncbi:MAG: NADH-quinone oxidoreductase subunit NuoH [Ktedonobacteraceae bacterium]|nr:NADH-quinone oxidoreductase subunit NuoH [Ktedonobacteraceae bacterium]
MLTVLADNVWTQLWSGIISWQFLQFVIALLSSIGFVLTSATILVLAERKIMAWMQDRYGPLHTGPWGLLQTVADVAKLLLKEDIHVSAIDKTVFLLAPSVFLAPVVAAFAVLPLSPYVSLPGTALATGIIYYVAMSSIDVIGVIMAGWGSNNKYSLIGGLRAAAQMISYELPLILALISVVMFTSVLANTGIGTLSIRDIMDYQNAWHITHIPVLDFIFEGFTPWAWFILVQPLMLVIYYVCGLAETNRPPFDLPEAESELVAGYLTEYSGMRWAMFFLGEYGNMTIVSAVTAYLFLGGWSGPGVSYLTGLNSPLWGLVGNLLGLVYLLLKIYGMCFVFIWVRSTLPRLRSDQLMQFAWLILIPITLVNILLTGAIYLVVSALGGPNWLFMVIIGVINWAGLFGFVQLVGRVTTSATRRAQAPAIRAQRRADVPSSPALPLRDAVPAQVSLAQSASATNAGGSTEA